MPLATTAPQRHAHASPIAVLGAFLTAVVNRLHHHSGNFDDRGTERDGVVGTLSWGALPVTDRVDEPRVAMDTVRPWDPDVEVFRRGSRMIIRADVPGFVASDVIVEIDHDVLKIAGDRRHAGDRGEGAGHPAFLRAIPVLDGIDARECAASLRDGVLEVAVPLPGSGGASRTRIAVA